VFGYMLQIIEHTPTRLVLQDRAPFMGLAFGLFTLFSLLFMVLLPGYNIIRLLPAGVTLQVLALAAILIVGCLFVYLGIGAALLILHGVTCIFDRPAATLTLTRIRHLRPITSSHPLYGFSHTEVVTNVEIGSCALYIVLRSGEKVLLTTAPVQDQARLEQVRQQIRAFVRS
jgi:hypothetical protein